MYINNIKSCMGIMNTKVETVIISKKGHREMGLE